MGCGVASVGPFLLLAVPLDSPNKNPTHQVQLGDCPACLSGVWLHSVKTQSLLIH